MFCYSGDSSASFLPASQDCLQPGEEKDIKAYCRDISCVWPGMTGSERMRKTLMERWKRKAKGGPCACFFRRELEELPGYGVRAKGGWELQEMIIE